MLLEQIFQILELSLITYLGIWIACRVYAYEISVLRKGGAALLFGVLSVFQLPIPIIGFLVPFVALYVTLMDDTYDRDTVNRVFVLTFAFAVLATVISYYWF